MLDKSNSTPVMVAGVTDKFWEFGDIMGVLEVCEATN
jgi:hypothetical protein